MKAAQARASVEALKDVQNDKSLKTKAEKERRIRYIKLLYTYTLKKLNFNKYDFNSHERNYIISLQSFLREFAR